MKTKNMLQVVVVGIALASMGLAACGDDSSSKDSSAISNPQNEIVISGQWIRTSPNATTTGAAYMTITAATDDALIGVSVDESVAESVELHEMVTTSGQMGMTDDMDHSSMNDHSMSGEMKMQQVMEIELPAGTAVQLKPGGLHIMFINLAQPLVTGDTIQLTLTFRNAGEITIDVPVQEDAP
jgi:periplasmic copper chaperone A